MWYRRHGALRDRPAAPVAAVLLYRKHVITGQAYIPQLIRLLEEQGVLPVPIFINGVEAHTVVRDMLTTAHERRLLGGGTYQNPGLRRDAVEVDAVINTIGFPLVGGPAGSAIEAGRQARHLPRRDAGRHPLPFPALGLAHLLGACLGQRAATYLACTTYMYLRAQADVAKSILSAKNVPYIVAAPLLIQDMASWLQDGIAGLQSVVLYSLPELDGAIDTVPLGGLVGEREMPARPRC